MIAGEFFHRKPVFDRMMDITLLGTGGVMPLPGRALTAAYVRVAGKVTLIDCGEGTQTAIRAAGLRFKPIEIILITHFHADHISGLPGLLLTMGNEGRTNPVTIYGPSGLEAVVSSLMTIVPELPFSVVLRTLPENPETIDSGFGLGITPIPLNHSVPCLGYCLTLRRPGKFDPRAALEKGVPVSLWSRLQQGDALEGFTPADVLGPERKGLRVLYATDTRPVPALEHLGRDADLLILEGMFGDPEKQQRARISCHMTMQEAATIAAEAHARRLWLTHYSPATPHPEEFRDSVQTIFPQALICSDGQTETLCFDDAQADAT